MGTNYYIKRKLSEETIEKLKKLLDNHEYEEVKNSLPDLIHIGKSSGGWKFLFNHNNWEYYKNIEELKNFISKNTLVDEYEREVSPTQFWDMVSKKQDSGNLDAESYSKRWEEFHPNDSKPDYMLKGKTHEKYYFGYRFSDSTHFS